LTTRADVIAEARRWIGTRWQHQASLKGIACDCIGLVAGVALELELPGAEAWRDDARRRSYTREPQPSMIFAVLDEYLDRIDVGELAPADVAVLRARHDLPPQHFGIIADGEPRTIVHAYAQMRKVVEQGFAPWAPLMVAAYRFRGLE